MKWLSVFIPLLLCGCLQIHIPPKPVPDDNVPTPIDETNIDKAARKAVKDYAAGLSQSFKEAASTNYADSGKANAELGSRNKAARTEAFKPIDAILDDSIGGDRWEPGKASKLFDQLGTAFDKAAK